MKKRTRCWACGNPGHLKRDCPKRGKGTTAGKGAKSKGKDGAKGFQVNFVSPSDGKDVSEQGTHGNPVGMGYANVFGVEVIPDTSGTKENPIILGNVENGENRSWSKDQADALNSMERELGSGSTLSYAVHSNVFRCGWGMPGSGAGLCVPGEEAFREYRQHLANFG